MGRDFEAPNYRSHNVTREDLPDGTLILRSGYERGPVVGKSSDWLHRWATERPDTVFLAERQGDGWREVTYAEALRITRAIGAALLARGLGQETPILIVSGNSVDHGLLTMGAHYVGVPTVPVAEQYALVPGAHRHLKHVIEVTRPRVVFAEDADRVQEALDLDEIGEMETIISRGDRPGATRLADLAATDPGPEVETANEAVGPDSVAKYLMTSGSTSAPKAVITTQRMMCVNQTQLVDALPFIAERPPVLVDWLPWNHVFGGSHNFNLVLANGGSLYIDDGKPAPGLFERTLENLSMQTGNISFNVPVGYAKLLETMRGDRALRRSFFEGLDMLFYAGAALPQDVWQGLEDMAREELGHVPLMNSSWGLTETAPAALIQHEPTTMSGIVGVPMTGVEVKLIPEGEGEENRYEVRVRGDSIMPGYLNDEEKTREAFDEEGYFRTGDVMGFVDPERMELGLRFIGRLTEEFKLTSGTWVRAATLRLELLSDLAGLVQDLVVTGANRADIGLLLFPHPAALAERGLKPDPADEVVTDESLMAAIRERLAARPASGSASRVARAMILSEPPSMPEGEMTAKGNINFKRVLARRAALVDRLHDDADPAVIKP
ncbi:AMP-binding protein [Aquicoccus sp. SCR17]|nr:AMP-binding protein [Carideicomes alvinocaridis]